MNPYHFFFAGMFTTAAVAWSPIGDGKLMILGFMITSTLLVTFSAIGAYKNNNK